VTDEYLWDRSGDPDPEVARLEELLGTLRSERPAPAWEVPHRRRAAPAWGRPGSLLASAAAVLAAVAAVVLGARPSWEFTWLEGPGWAEARVAGRDRLKVGEWLETRKGSRARLRVGTIGQVEVEPQTRLRLLDAGRRDHRLSMARGAVRAMIWAPPGDFFINTPSAVAVDLGCEYTLEVDDAGAGVLRVLTGWVGIEHQGRESFVPRAAMCLSRPGVGPGTPYYQDASPALQHALEALDFGRPEARAAALATVLGEARPRDAFSLWHLLSRAQGDERRLVYDRLAVLVPPPRGVTPAGVSAGNQEMLDAWWDELDLGSAGFWRMWKAPWAPKVPTPGPSAGR
jgi:FecR-like protein